MMKRLTLKSISDLDGTRGELFDGTEHICYTLERPNLNNNKNTSCIPSGIYKVQKTYSPKFKRDFFEVKDVPNREGIRIHPANIINQLHGCIAVGNKIIEDYLFKGHVYKYGIVGSFPTCQILLELFPEGFELEIIRSNEKDL